jgi:ion channel-forming bestrophin family protein
MRDQSSVIPPGRGPRPVTPDSTATLPSHESPKVGLGRALGMWLHPFTRLHRIPVFKRVWLYLAVMAVYTGVVDWVTDQGGASQILKEASNAAYIGAIFGILLVFRTNSAYERWWEGRRLWGQLVNDSRNLIIKVKTYVKVPHQAKLHLGEQVVSFAFALKHHLRDTRPTRRLPGVKTSPENQHLPAQVTVRIYETVQTWFDHRQLNEFTLLILDPHLRAFMDICGACERIKSTPLAVSYRAFMRQGILLNLLILPWYVVPQIDIWFSMPVIIIGAYFLIGLELIAEDIEEPFGEDGDDLPLDQICANIQRSIVEILGAEEDDDPLKYTGRVAAVKIDPLKESLFET